jgi:DNA polymerase-1
LHAQQAQADALHAQAPNCLGRVEEGKKVAKKQMDIVIHGLWGPDVRSPLQPDVYTASGWPAVSTPVLRGLAGKAGAAKRALHEAEGVPLQTAPDDGARA